MSNNDENFIMKVINAILSHGVDGLGPIPSSIDIAENYKQKHYPSMEKRIDSLIRWQSTWNFGTGFVTGLGGLLTLPVTIPASLYSGWVIQARLAGAVAYLHGFDIKDDKVRTLILLTLIGNAGREVLKEAGIKISNRVALNAVRQIPGKVCIEINKKVGFRLVTKAGEKGVVNLTKVVPIVGGFVGGGIDAAGCYTVGKAANMMFTSPPELYVLPRLVELLEDVPGSKDVCKAENQTLEIFKTFGCGATIRTCSMVLKERSDFFVESEGNSEHNSYETELKGVCVCIFNHEKVCIYDKFVEWTKATMLQEVLKQINLLPY